jgi:predicted  nucleic acid-binding Zn-ribbon protein
MILKKNGTMEISNKKQQQKRVQEHHKNVTRKRKLNKLDENIGIIKMKSSDKKWLST